MIKFFLTNNICLNGLECFLIISINSLFFYFLAVKYISEKYDIEISYNNLVQKEIHHRIKNNFHLILSILHFESKKNKHSDNVYLEIINRIKSFSLIHEHLSNRTNQNITIKEYLSVIINNIKIRYLNYQNIRIIENIDSLIKLNYQYSLCLGVILNELITNSLKHNKGFFELEVSVYLRRRKNKIIFIVRDNGKGFIEKNQSNSLGLGIIKDFCRRIDNCSYRIYSNNGAVFELMFVKKVLS